MGSASSLSITCEEKEAVIQKLKLVYEKNIELTDHELEKLLAEEYRNIVEEDSKKKSCHQPSPTSVVQETIVSSGSKKNNKPLGTKPSNKTSCRRRSFDNPPNMKKPTASPPARASFSSPPPAKTASHDSIQSPPTTSNITSPETSAIKKLSLLTTEIMQSKSSATLQLGEDAIAIDNWSSVTQQPYCDICKMFFKSDAFLNRHLKYSNLHVDNEKRLTDKGKESIVPLLSSPLPKGKITKETILKNTGQEEGIHYRLLYSGNKFFWRIQQSIDLDMYHHFLANTIEIIPYHPMKHKELPRIYINYDILVKQNESLIQEEVNKKKKSILQENKFVQSIHCINEQQLMEEITLRLLVTFLLQRISFEPSNANDEQCTFLRLFGDEQYANPVYGSPVAVLIPIQLTRRRRSTAEEISQTMERLDHDHMIINANLQKAYHFTSQNENNDHDSKVQQQSHHDHAHAEKIANIVYATVTILYEKLAHRYQYHSISATASDSESERKARKYQYLWRKAINTILLQLLVKKNRDYLATLVTASPAAVAAVPVPVPVSMAVEHVIDTNTKLAIQALRDE